MGQKYNQNPYWQGRGLPGTHDMRLGKEVLTDLIYGSSDGNTVWVPQYDKAAFDGEGDRLAMKDYKKIDDKIDLVIVEGWMLGYKHIHEPVISQLT